MEVELRLTPSKWRRRGPLFAMVVLLILVGIGVLGVAYTAETDGQSLLLTPARYDLYRYQNQLSGWCRDLQRAEEVAAEVLAHQEPDALIHGPALRSAWSSLENLERDAEAAPVDGLSLREEVLVAVEADRMALTAAGVCVNRPTRKDRLDLQHTLEAARQAREAVCMVR